MDLGIGLIIFLVLLFYSEIKIVLYLNRTLSKKHKKIFLVALAIFLLY